MNRTVCKILNGVKRNIPVILSCASVVGLSATTVLAVRATPKALRLIDEKKEEAGGELTPKETVAVVWKCYIPTAIVFIGTASCIISAAILNKREQAALASAYALISSSYDRYKDKVKELYGEEAHKKVIASIAAEKAKDIQITSEAFWTSTTLDFGDEEEEVLFYDVFSDRYFTSTVNRVLQAEYALNRNYFLNCNCQTLNDFYNLLGIEETDEGSVIGWYLDDYQDLYWIDFDHHKETTDDGLEVHVIEMITAPTTLCSDYIGA